MDFTFFFFLETNSTVCFFSDCAWLIYLKRPLNLHVYNLIWLRWFVLNLLLPPTVMMVVARLWQITVQKD